MSNRERAAEVIRTWQARHKTEMDNNTTWAAQNLAGDLDHAGLLAPDTDHPATLTTVADFAAAPIGTVVTHPGGAAVKARKNWWLITGIGQSRLDNSIGDYDEEDPRTVLRWGKQILPVPHVSEAEFDEYEVFIKTMNSAWVRGRVQQADLKVFAEHGAKVTRSLYVSAGLGDLTMNYLLRFWEKNATEGRTPRDDT